MWHNARAQLVARSVDLEYMQRGDRETIERPRMQEKNRRACWNPFQFQSCLF